MSAKIELPKQETSTVERDPVKDLKMVVLFPLHDEITGGIGQAFFDDLKSQGYNVVERNVFRHSEALQSVDLGRVREFTFDMCRKADVVHVILPSHVALKEEGERWFAQMLLGVRDAMELSQEYRQYILPVKTTNSDVPVMFSKLTVIDITQGNGAFELNNAWGIAAAQKEQFDGPTSNG